MVTMVQTSRTPRLGLDIPMPARRSRKVSTTAPSSYSAVDSREMNAPEVHRYPHTTVFREGPMEVHVRSPSTMVTAHGPHELSRYLPVFSDHDRVEGIVVIDAGAGVRGKLTVSMEGSFLYLSPNMEAHGHIVDGQRSGVHRHVFFLSSTVVPVTSLETRRSASSLREAISTTVRPLRRQRRPSQSDIVPIFRHFPFSFELPRGQRHGEEMPPSFSSVLQGLSGARSRAFVERVEVEYTVTATWEPSREDIITVEAPIILEPEHDFRSLDSLELERDSWLETSLASDRPIPFTCAIALPDPPVFSRSSSLPYFVVFTTTPRSVTLAHEIAADATVAVSLVREVHVDVPLSSPASSVSTPSASRTPLSPPSSFNVADLEIPPPRPPRPLLKRVVKSAPPSLTSRALPRLGIPPLAEKPLPQVPEEWLSDRRTVQTDVSVGFPKRPRPRLEPNQRHPRLSTIYALPDGLYKGKLQLDKNLVPGFEWTGLSVKYFLDVSVTFGQDELRNRIPIQIN